MLAPVAVNIAEPPAQMELFDGLTPIANCELTFTTATVELLQPPLVPITVYVAEETGLALTTLPDVVFNPAAGVQL